MQLLVFDKQLMFNDNKLKMTLNDKLNHRLPDYSLRHKNWKTENSYSSKDGATTEENGSRLSVLLSTH